MPDVAVPPPVVGGGPILDVAEPLAKARVVVETMTRSPHQRGGPSATPSLPAPLGRAELEAGSS